MRNAYRVVTILAGIAVLSVALLIAMPVVSDYLPPGMYKRTYDFQNIAARVLFRIIPVAEACAILGIFIAAAHSRGRIFREDRWLHPMIGVILVAMAIAVWFIFGWLIGGGFP